MSRAGVRPELKLGDFFELPYEAGPDGVPVFNLEPAKLGKVWQDYLLALSPEARAMQHRMGR